MWELNLKNVLLVVALFAAILFVYKSMYPSENWTLMVCKTKLGKECQENSYVIPGYKSQKECMSAGILMAKNEGFECGKDCHMEGSLQVCDPICNENGCFN